MSAASWDDVDWSQFKEGDQFTGLVAVSMTSGSPVIVNVHSPYHADLVLVVNKIMDDNGQSLDDIGVNTDDGEFETPGVYDVVFELTDDGNDDDGINFKVIRSVPVSVRQTLQARPKMDGMTSFDRKKAQAAMRGEEIIGGEPVSVEATAGMSIQW